MIFKRLFSHAQRFYCSSSSLPSFEKVIYSKHEPIITIGINNPDRKNALDKQTIAELIEALDHLENDKTALAGVIYGECGNFCVGYDLKELSENVENPPEHFMFNKLTERFTRKPLIAGVSGFAIGAGLDLALMCDLRIMESTAAFGCFNRRFGVPLSDYAIRRLNAMIGMSRTMEFVTTGRGIRGEEALAIGLANRIVESGTAPGIALNIANEMSKFPQAALRRDRANIYKFSFPDHSQIELIKNESFAYNEQMIEDMKVGAKLFAEGHGRKGKNLSRFLWEKCRNID